MDQDQTLKIKKKRCMLLSDETHGGLLWLQNHWCLFIVKELLNFGAEYVVLRRVNQYVFVKSNKEHRKVILMF